jgi:signal transduction histidine kinase
MLRFWQRVLHLVSDGTAPTETRYILATNMNTALSVVVLSLYLVVALAADAVAIVFIILASFPSYCCVFVLNHLRLRTAASIWLTVTATSVISAGYWMLGAGFNGYLIVVAAAAPIVHRPRHVVGRLVAIVVPTCLFVTSVIHSGQHTPVFPLPNPAAWTAGNLVGMGVLMIAITFYGDVIAFRAETQLHEAQAQLIEAEKSAAIARLVAGILHEINNPLGAIRSSSGTMTTAMTKASELLAATEPASDPSKEQKRALRSLKAGLSLGNTVDEAVDRIASTVAGLKRFVNLDAADHADIDVRQSLDDAIAILGCTLERNYDDPLPDVRCAPMRLNHVLLELLQNAVDAVGREGRIHVTAQRDADGVVVRIEDDGPGIPEGELKKIFDVGFADSGGRVAMKLGLPMAKRHVEEIGGALSIESSAEAGTTVRVSLPVAPHSKGA